VSDNELGTFLRARRETVTPASVGLPAGPRRRTPGLRRAELATLAGISVEYLTRLEQGRDRHPSAQVLAAIGDALRLSAEDRIHLRLLTKATTGHVCQAAEPASSVRPTIRAMLDRLEPTPAVVVNRLSDILAHTDGYVRVAGPIGLLDGHRPNLARFVFTDERARTAYPSWAAVADAQVAYLKIESYRADPHVTEMVEDLTITAGAAFTDRLGTTTALPPRTGTELVHHPDVGPLRLDYETLDLTDADDQRLIVYLPADAATAAALDTLTGRRPGALRAVSG
jgi:transcriptional regulator with XRE-family HTH domain